MRTAVFWIIWIVVWTMCVACFAGFTEAYKFGNCTRKKDIPWLVPINSFVLYQAGCALGERHRK